MTIEHGIPIPTHRRGKPVATVERLSALGIGDSFLCPSYQQSRISILAQRAGIGLITRTVSETQIRVWRSR